MIYYFLSGDFTGFVISIWSSKSKIDTIKIMKKRNPLINEPHLETLRARNVPVIFRNISTISNGALFLNTFLHSKMEEGVTVNVKLSDQSNLSVKDIKIKGNGTFAVSWCIKWFENIQTRTS